MYCLLVANHGPFFSSFQEVQGLSAVETSVRFIPNVAIGVVQTLAVGLVLHRTSPYWVVVVSCLLTALSPLLMALNDPNWTYWYAGFWALLLSPISGDSELCPCFVTPVRRMTDQ